MKYYVCNKAIVPEEEALDFALEECMYKFDSGTMLTSTMVDFSEKLRNLGEFAEMFGRDIIDWFYSDVWSEVEADSLEEAFEKYQKRLEKPEF